MAHRYQIFKDRSEFSTYHAWRRDHPRGFVLNVKPDECLYHQAQCSHLNPTVDRERKGRFQFWKVCADSLTLPPELPPL